MAPNLDSCSGNKKPYESDIRPLLLNVADLSVSSPAALCFKGLGLRNGLLGIEKWMSNLALCGAVRKDGKDKRDK